MAATQHLVRRSLAPLLLIAVGAWAWQLPSDPVIIPGFWAGALTSDRVGGVYIGDLGNHTVWHLRADGRCRRVPGTRGITVPVDLAQVQGMQYWEYPQSLACDPRGNLYVADPWQGAILRVNRLGARSAVAWCAGGGSPGGRGPGIRYPAGLAVDPQGRLLVADLQGHRVWRVDGDGSLAVVAGKGQQGFGGWDPAPAASIYLDGPAGMTVDVEGNLYLTETWDRIVRKVDQEGIASIVAGAGGMRFGGDGGPATEAILGRPTDVALDAEGNLYIADIMHNRVRKVDPEGTITTAAGSGVRGEQGDGGLAVNSDLLYPRRIAADTRGNLYIGAGGRVRRVRPDGTIDSVVKRHRLPL